MKIKEKMNYALIPMGKPSINEFIPKLEELLVVLPCVVEEVKEHKLSMIKSSQIKKCI